MSVFPSVFAEPVPFAFQHQATWVSVLALRSPFAPKSNPSVPNAETASVLVVSALILLVNIASCTPLTESNIV